MDLELRNVQVKDVVLGDKNDLKDGVLTVDVEGLKKLILEDPRVTAVKVDLAKPGESCRILPVKDVVEPRYKPEGEIFPGVFGSDVPEVGSGVTYVLKGCAVVTTGPIVGFQEGLIDMSGPAAQYTLFSKLNNVVLHLTKREDVDQHEHEEVVRMAGLKAARWLGEVAVKAESYDSEFYHWPTAAEACLVGISFGRSRRFSLPKPMAIAPEDTRMISWSAFFRSLRTLHIRSTRWIFSRPVA